MKTKNFLASPLSFALLCLFLVFFYNLLIQLTRADYDFFSFTWMMSNDGYYRLGGNLISIFDYGSELALLAIGMTLVTSASGGQDISVGAAIAIAGSAVMRVLCGTENQPAELHAPILAAFAAGCCAGMLAGAFNGALVSVFKIQPMVATLILFTAGRSIGSMILGGNKPMTNDSVFKIFGNNIPNVPIPTPILISLLCFALVALALRFTNLRLYAQAVGINERAARLNGLNPVLIKMLAYMILGLCVGIAGFIKVSRIEAINPIQMAPNIEMDAILAVALGGNALSGGKFSMAGSVVGAYTLQALTTTLYANDVSSDAMPAFKAVVIILIVVFQSPAIRAKLAALRKSRLAGQGAGTKKEVA
jgi:simple sugar transport system permease protein